MSTTTMAVLRQAPQGARAEELAIPAHGAMRRVLARVAREPFVHFVLLGAALFGLGEWLEARANYARVTISQAQIDQLASNYQLEYGALPSRRDLDALIQNFVKEEVFYRQALRLGLDRDDEIVRRRMVQKYEFLQQDLAVAHEPTTADLQSFYAAHSANYTVPLRRSFTHVYFSVDLHGERGAEALARKVLLQLDTHDVARAPDRGDSFPGQSDYAQLTQVQVARAFGESEFSRQLFQAPVGHWVGPYRSGYGWHLVRATEEVAPAVASFADAHDTVRRDYLDAARGAQNAEAYQKLLKTFTIVRTP